MRARACSTTYTIGFGAWRTHLGLEGAPLLPAEKRERYAEIGRQVERERGTVDGGEYLDSAKERSARVSRPFREITMHFGTWMIGGFATWEASSWRSWPCLRGTSGAYPIGRRSRQFPNPNSCTRPSGVGRLRCHRTSAKCEYSAFLKLTKVLVYTITLI